MLTKSENLGMELKLNNFQGVKSFRKEEFFLVLHGTI